MSKPLGNETNWHQFKYLVLIKDWKGAAKALVRHLIRRGK